jgi:hypothetical protein
MDYRQLYNLEAYLLDTVRIRFQRDRKLSAFDFFCIVIWKANRSKSKIAAGLLRRGYKTLDAAVEALTRGLAKTSSPKERLRYLIIEWKLRLPMATAALTILYPDDFTVYDGRVCGVLGGYKSLANRTNFENLWLGYQDFKAAVEKAVPDARDLRDKDRYLWGKSFALQLKEDIEAGFPRRSTTGETRSS